MSTAEKFKKEDRLQNILLRDNLLSLMKIRGASMAEIHRQTHVPITTIQRICKDPDANPTLASLIPIADFFSLTLAQLIGEEPLPSNTELGSKPHHWSNVPLISWQLAAQQPNLDQNTHPQHLIATEVPVSNKAFALEIQDSYHDNFHEGSTLIIDPNIEPDHRDYIISQKKGTSVASLKQLLIHEGDYYLKPSNPEFKTHLMDETHKIIGVVVQIRMNLK